MIRSHILLAALGLATAACGGSQEQSARNDRSGADAQPDVMANAAGADGVVPGGAVDVLRREGWRVETIQQADASATGQPPTTAG